MLIFFILLTLLLSAFFSGSEIAYISANKLGIEVLKNKGNQKGRILARFFEKPKEFLGTMLVGNNISLVIFTMLMTTLLEPTMSKFVGDQPFVVSFLITLVVTIVVLIFGEYLPKTIFRLYSNEMLYRLSYPLSFFKSLLVVPSWIMTSLSDFIIKRVFKIKDLPEAEAFSRIDLEQFIHDSISEDEDIDKEILTNALKLGQVKVRDCMIPRTEIVHVERSATIDEVINTFRDSKLSRILVIEEDVDNITGYIHHQQLLDNPRSLRKLPIELDYVPEAMNAQELLLKFMKERNNIACVVDEFGGTAGLITLEDILEEIFGEIEDEHDEEERIEEQLSEDEFVFSGRLEIDYLNEKYEAIQFPEGEFHTLSGYIVMTSGNIPAEGESMELDGYQFILEKVSDTKIEVVRVIRLESEAP